MIDKSKLQEYLAIYKQEFIEKIWPEEKYKWEAVKCFQSNWNIDANDFPEMLKNSLAKTKNLLQNRKFAKDMIVELSYASPNTVRKMFSELFNEEDDLYVRIKKFKNRATELCNSISPEKTHYQDENTITIYLWLKYPDKYYIYKQSLAKVDAEALQAGYQFKKGDYAQNIKDFMLMYDEMNAVVSHDEELVNLLKENLTDETCWPDTKYKTLTVDISYYIWVKTKEKSEIKKAFYKYLGEDDSLSGYTRSYKLVLLKYLFEIMDEDGVVDFKEVTEKFKNYYLDRKNKGLLPDMFVNNVIANIETSDDDKIKEIILKYPYKYIHEKGFIYRQTIDGSEQLCLNENLIVALDENDLINIKKIIDNKLALYYQRIDGNKITPESDIQWIIPNNPTYYNAIAAFNELKSVEWKQHHYKFKVGQIVYVYVSDSIHALRLKCHVSKIDLEKPNIIDDKFYVNKSCKQTKTKSCEVNETESKYNGKYMELTFDKNLTGKDGEDCYDIEKIKENGYVLTQGAERVEDSLREYLDSLENEGEVTMVGAKQNFSKNMILFGPPGTGKTYSTVLYAVAIIEGKTIEEIQKEVDDNSYKDVLDRYNDYKSKKWIEFTTFHQSYGYEEFIEGIKPVMEDGNSDEVNNNNIQYQLMPGVFKSFCERAITQPVINKEKFGINDSPTIWKVSLQGAGKNDVRTDCLKEGHIRIGWPSYGDKITGETNFAHGGKAVLDAFINKMQVGDIVLSCYSSTVIDAIGVITGEYEWHDEYPDEYKRLRKVAWLVKNIEENIVSINNGKTMTLSTVYKLNNMSLPDVLGIVTKHTTDLKDNEKTNTNIEENAGGHADTNNYVFIIDEINRGNISKIFGELITLIEESKRLGEDEAMTAQLPYSPDKPPFGVPNNIYLIGTMNTADRSIATIDTALRRRFKFIEMQPNIDKLKDIKVDGVSVDEMLDRMNKRITVLYDREHTIGHSYFMPLKINPDISVLADIFRNNIIPLLQEYFYDDYEKIALVLGDNQKKQEDYKFITVTNNNYKELFGNEDVELDESKSFTINDAAFSKIESYKGI